ncbi:MAG: hypothetical protein ABW023_10690 [Sphingomonas sp.]
MAIDRPEIIAAISARFASRLPLSAAPAELPLLRMLAKSSRLNAVQVPFDSEVASVEYSKLSLSALAFDRRHCSPK